MKKLIFDSMFLISIAVSGLDVNAQNMAFNRSSVTVVNPYPDSGNKRIVSEIEVSINAARDFKKNFKNATDVKWVQHENGVSVYFTNDGKKMRSSYNAKGKKEYTLKYYDESGMTSELRHRVKSNYYDYSIAIVTEVTRNNQTYYLVKMENQIEYLTLNINDEEITVFEKTNKAN